ncbi:MAG TPA: EamA family transporter [Gaiellaceae bacterium]
MRRRRPGHGHARRARQLNALALALALGSSVVWGCADFGGGMLTRRLPVFAVTCVSQAAGFVAICAVVVLRGELSGRSFAFGLLSGVGGGIGLASFYRALSLGTMSVVSPIAACSAVVPFVLSLATGERPATVAAIGAIVALAGAIVASLEERSAAGDRSRAIVLAVVAAAALGLFVYFLGLGSREGDAVSTLFGARVGSLSVLVALAVSLRAPLRVPRTSAGAVAAVGVADIGANALFAYASGHGLLALVSVLGSLYPVITVLLAHVLLGERLTSTQKAGVAIALAGVCAVAAA